MSSSTYFQKLFLLLKVFMVSMDHVTDVLVLWQLFDQGYHKLTLLGIIIDLVQGPVTVLTFYHTFNYSWKRSLTLILAPLNIYIHTSNYLFFNLDDETVKFSQKVMEYSAECQGLVESPLQLIFTTTLMALRILPSPLDPDKAIILENYFGAKINLSFMPVISVVTGLASIIVNTSKTIPQWSAVANSFISNVISWGLFATITVLFRLSAWTVLCIYLGRHVTGPLLLIFVMNIVIFSLNKGHVKSGQLLLALYSLVFPVTGLASTGDLTSEDGQGVKMRVKLMRYLSIMGVVILTLTLWLVFGLVIVFNIISYDHNVRLRRDEVLSVFMAITALALINLVSAYILGKTMSKQLSLLLNGVKVVMAVSAVIIFVLGLTVKGKQELEFVMNVDRLCLSKLNAQIHGFERVGPAPVSQLGRIELGRCSKEMIEKIGFARLKLVACVNATEMLVLEDLAPSTPLPKALVGLHLFLLLPGTKTDHFKSLFKEACHGKTFKTEHGRNALHLAVELGANDEIRYLLDQGLHPNDGDQDNVTPLHLACTVGNTGGIRLLLQSSKTTVDPKDKAGNSPLMDCAFKDNLEAVELLVEAGADANHTNSNQISVVMAAASGGGVETTLYLINKQVDLHHQDLADRNLCHYACLAIKTNSKVLQEIIAKGIDCHVKDKFSQDIPFLIAARFNNLKAVQFMLKNGFANDTLATNINVDIALGEAVFKGHMAMVQLLLKAENREQQLTHQNKIGFTPLHFAAYKGHDHLVLLLVKSGANLEAHSAKNHTPLMTAINSNQSSTALQLLEIGAKVDDHNLDGENCLHLTCRSIFTNTSVMAALVAKGTKLEEKTTDLDQSTPCATCCKYNNIQNVKWLLTSTKVNLAATDRFNKTPLAIASFYNNTDIVGIILQHRPDLVISTRQNEGAMHYGAIQGNLPMVKLLLPHTRAEVLGQRRRGNRPIDLARLNGHWQLVNFLETVMNSKTNMTLT